MTLKSFKKDLKKYVLNEAKILKEFSHKNVIKYYNWYETRNHFWVIYEYLGGSNLQQIIEEDQNIEESLLRQLAVQLMDVLISMHQKDIFFCDFKPSNFVFDEYSNIKFVDFMLAQMKQLNEFQNENFSADPDYLAPEIKKKSIYFYQANQNTDIYGFGCLLYYLATGKPPQFVNQTTVIPIKGYSQEFNKLILGCLIFDPKQRFKWSDIVNLPWISVLKECQQGLNDLLNISKNFDKNSDTSDLQASQYIQNRKNSEYSQVKTEHFLDDNSIRNNNSKSEKNFKMKSSAEKDTISQKSALYLDVSIHENNDSNEKKQTDQVPNFSIPSEVFEKYEKQLNKKLLYKLSEKNIEHIMLNERIEKVVLNINEMIQNFDQKQLETDDQINQQLTLLQKNWIKSDNTSDKIEYLKFIIKITYYKGVANNLIAHQLYNYLINDLNKTVNQNLKFYLCIVIGCIFRFITTDIKIVQIKNYQIVFQQLIQNENSQISNKALAAFGELMFYIFSQSKENMKSISSSFFKFLAQSLKEKMDDITYLRYAAKIIENCSTTECGEVFANQNFIKNLILCMKKNKDEIFSSYCLNIFRRLIEIDPELVIFITTKDNMKIFLKQIIKENPKTSIDSMNLINKILIQNNSQKTTAIVKKIGQKVFIQTILENIQTDNIRLASKSVVTVIILIIKNFEFFEYILQFTKILNIIDQKLQKQTQTIDDYFIQVTQILHNVIGQILNFWFDEWQNKESTENLKQQSVVFCSYLHFLSEVQFFIENYINNEILISIFQFGDIITHQINAKNYDILKSNYVQTLQNIIKSDVICQNFEQTFLQKIAPYLINSLNEEKTESILFMNFSILIDIFNRFFSQKQFDKITQETKLLFAQILSLSKKLIKQDQDEEISLNSFRIIATLLLKQYIQNIPSEFDAQEFTVLISEYVKDNYSKMNVNIFSIMIFILQQSHTFVFRFYQLQLIDYAIDYLKQLNKYNYEPKILFFFYTVFEIIHKAFKKEKLPKSFHLNIENFQTVMKKLYQEFFCKNFFEEDLINTFYYCQSILKNYQTKNNTKITLTFQIDKKTFIKMLELFKNEPPVQKKVQKIIKMNS